MNILLVTMEMQVGGAETHIFELAKELKRRNHNVFVMSAGGKYADLLEKCGIVHIYAPLKNKKPINMFNSYNAIKNTIKENNIDIVHAHARIPAFISGKVCKKMKIPFVTTVHGVYKVNFLLKLLTNWGEKTLTVSEDIRSQVIKDYKLNPKNVSVTVNGINTDDFCKEEINKDIGIDKNKFNIVHVSRLDNESSNVAEMLIKIFKEIQEKPNNSSRLIIVGDGNYFENIKDLVGQEDSIILTGLRTDVANILKCSNLFVGVSRAALEAMSCELPVILAGNKDYGQGFIGIFDESKANQAINTNFCCRGCQEVTEKLLFDSIMRIYSMEEGEKAKLGKYGRSIVKEYYSIEKMTDDAEKMYLSFFAKKC